MERVGSRGLSGRDRGPLAAGGRTMIPPGAGRFVLGDRVQLKVAAEETGGVLSLFQASSPGQGPPLHRHENEDECFVVLWVGTRCCAAHCGAPLVSAIASSCRAASRTLFAIAADVRRAFSSWSSPAGSSDISKRSTFWGRRPPRASIAATRSAGRSASRFQLLVPTSRLATPMAKAGSSSGTTARRSSSEARARAGRCRPTRPEDESRCSMSTSRPAAADESPPPQGVSG